MNVTFMFRLENVGRSTPLDRRLCLLVKISSSKGEPFLAYKLTPKRNMRLVVRSSKVFSVNRLDLSSMLGLSSWLRARSRLRSNEIE